MKNHHATALVLGERGIMIEGGSGSGKTLLALQMLSHASSHGVFSCLVADDQLLLSVRSGRLLAHAPSPIAGLAEARGVGPSPVAFLPHAVIDLVARLVESGEAPRFYDDEVVVREGVTLPSLDLPRSQVETGVQALSAYLRLPPFSGRNTTS